MDFLTSLLLYSHVDDLTNNSTENTYTSSPLIEDNERVNLSINMSSWNPIIIDGNKASPQSIDFHDLKENGIIGVIHRATMGTTGIDSQYHQARIEAEKEGLLWGAYHTGKEQSVDDQVKHFLDTVGDKKDNVILSLNLLTGVDPVMTKDSAEKFVTQIEEKTGHKPLVYGSFYHLQNDMDSDKLHECPLWLARFTNSTEDPTTHPTAPPKGWEEWKLWNYTDGTHGPPPHGIGHTTVANRDVFNGTKEELEKFWKSF